jgi:tetratricopeptide (TPR) repeat protein
VIEKSIDVNAVMSTANWFRNEGDFQSALELYLFLADGDPSLDGGWLGVQIAECYEALGRMNEARYWAGRAENENPTLPDRREIRERLGSIDVDDMVGLPSVSVWTSGGTQIEADETQRILTTIPGGAALLKLT